MKRIIGVVFILVNIIIFDACLFQAPAQAAQPQQLTGTIANIDFIDSEITIKYLQPNGENDEIMLKLTSHTKVDRGNVRAELTNVNEGDEVAVEYYDDPMSFSEPKASQINLK